MTATGVDPDPPANIDAEVCALGACLVSDTAADEVAERLTAEHFYRPAHAAVFAAVLAVRAEGGHVDPVVVAAELDRRGDLVRVGGLPYLHTLMASVPTAANAGYWAELVADCALRRRLLEVGQRARQRAGSAGHDAMGSIEATRAELDRIADGAGTRTDAVPIGTLAADALVRYGERADVGLPTPWTDLNAVIGGGLRPGTLTVVAARPGKGKSVWGAQAALWAALEGRGVLVASLEMPRDEVTDRILSALARVEYRRVVTKQLSDDDWDSVQVAVDKLDAAPLTVVDSGHQTLAGLRALARTAAHQEAGLDLLVIDYLQLMAPTDPRAPRQEQVAANSRGLKLLAKDLGIAVVVLSQLNRASEQRADKKPGLAELRESGAIEQDADLVVLLHHPEEDARSGELDFLVEKNRRGSRCVITTVWAPHYQEIRDLARAY